jgi:hypothetical protein
MHGIGAVWIFFEISSVVLQRARRGVSILLDAAEKKRSVACGALAREAVAQGPERGECNVIPAQVPRCVRESF